jgi:GTPase SAR1 family protein
MENRHLCLQAAAAPRLKIAIVGDKGVGKGSFARRFSAADFECVEEKDAEVGSASLFGHFGGF